MKVFLFLILMLIFATSGYAKNDTWISDSDGHRVDVNADGSLPSAQSGTWTIGQSGTWTVQPGNTQNTIPWLTISSTSSDTVVSSNQTTIKNSSGYLYSVSVNRRSLANGYLVLYDHPSLAAGRVIASVDTTYTVGTLIFNTAFANGLTYANVGSSGDVTVTRV